MLRITATIEALKKPLALVWRQTKTKITHAVALIEKRLRSDGLIDQESKILIHQIKNVGNGYQALYTAIPLSEWQRMFSWAENQADHCLFLPYTALLWARLKVGQGLVFRCGKHISFLAYRKHQILHASATAFSTDSADLSLAVGALAERVREQLAKDDQEAAPMSVTWYPAMSHSIKELEQPLVQVFTQGSQTAVQLATCQAYLDSDQGTLYSALPELGRAFSIRYAVNSPNSKAMYGAERVLPWISAASLLLASALFIQAGSWALNGNAIAQQASDLMKKTQPVMTRIALLAEARKMPPEYQSQLEFIERARHNASQTDPERILDTLRQASAGGIRLLRVYLIEIKSNKKNQPNESVLAVDGVIDASLNVDPGALLARFVGNLRTAGYEATSVDPSSLNVSSQPPAGFFSYQLRPFVKTGAQLDGAAR